MRALLLEHLLAAAREVGISLRGPVTKDEPHNLYVWTTPEDEVLYIGKAASRRRTQEEETWAKAYNAKEINIGFTVLMNRHDARCVLLFADDLDRGRARAALADWKGPAIDVLERRLSSGITWSPAEIELVLIRMAVLAGYPIANATGSGQWESRMGRDDNTLAAVAVVNSDALRYEAVLQMPADAQVTSADDPVAERRPGPADT